MEFESNSYEETQKFAEEFSKTLEAGDVLCMYGDLGVGKTAFVQGLAKGLGIDEPITSPTFTIVNEYSGRLPLYHFDVYRIADSDEMYEIGYEEYVYGDGVSVINPLGGTAKNTAALPPLNIEILGEPTKKDTLFSVPFFV